MKSKQIEYSKDDIERYIKNNYSDITRFCNTYVSMKEVNYITGETIVIPILDISFSVPISELTDGLVDEKQL